MSLVGKDYKSDEQILKIIWQARRLEISSCEAEEKISKRLDEYFPNNNTWTNFLGKMSAMEKLTEGFHSSGGRMATPLNERYSEKHGLTGRLSPMTAYCPPETTNKKRRTKKRSHGTAVKGLDKKNFKEPLVLQTI